MKNLTLLLTVLATLLLMPALTACGDEPHVGPYKAKYLKVYNGTVCAQITSLPEYPVALDVLLGRDYPKHIDSYVFFSENDLSGKDVKEGDELTFLILESKEWEWYMFGDDNVEIPDRFHLKYNCKIKLIEP